MSENLQNFQRFNRDLKRTAVGVRFTKKLFTEPYTLSPSQITATMRTLGLDIPEGLEIAADAAQILTTGQALIDTYQSAQDVQSLVNPTAQSLRVVTGVLERNGMISSEGSQTVQMGTTLALLFASGGMDIKSWLSLGLMIMSADAEAKAKAMMRAQLTLKDFIEKQITKEAENFARAFTLLQEKKVGAFGFLVEAATEGSLIYKNAIIDNPNLQGLRDYLPGINFIPTGRAIASASSFARNRWTRQIQTADFQIELEALAIGKSTLTREEAFDFIFSNVIEAYLVPFLGFNNEMRARGYLDLIQAASLIGINQNLRFDYSVIETMKNGFLTPFNLGFLDYEKYLPNYLTTSGIISSEKKELGIDDYSKEKAIQANRAGFSPYLFKNDVTRKIIEQRMSFNSEEQKQLTTAFVGTNFSPYRVADFIASLEMLDAAINDPLTQELNGESKAFFYSQYFPRVEEFKNQVVEITNLSTIRRNNVLAKINAAAMLGVDEKNIKIYKAPANAPEQYSIIRGI